ncbi:hypothetical protein DFH08DRAFT_948324 [Mycena albidolilacea]|uniref:Uncharacterized protein n=1 Tax=Mycena albidolilacea TaxID=1033008 RepID=A0AAD7AQV8_9AGAR|nr:hypothetical protein DFH08DRAFT_948324 [Mycena albidolilacea]
MFDEGNGDGILLDNLADERLSDGTWKEVIDDDTEKAQEEEARVVKEKVDAKKRKKKEQGAAAAKSQGGQLAAAVSGSNSIPKCLTATTPGTITPNAKRVRKLIQTPEEVELLEVPSPSEAEAAVITVETNKRPAKRTRGHKVSFTNPVASTGETTDTPPAKRKVFVHKVFIPGAQGLPTEAFSLLEGLQGLRDERDEQGHFIMLPERLLQLIQNHAAELVVSQAMKVLTESGMDHEVKDDQNSSSESLSDDDTGDNILQPTFTQAKAKKVTVMMPGSVNGSLAKKKITATEFTQHISPAVNTAIPLHIGANIKGRWKQPFLMIDLIPAACVLMNKARDKKEDRQLIQQDGKFVLAEDKHDNLSGDKLMTATDFLLASKNLIEAVKHWYTPELLQKLAGKNIKKHFKALFERDKFRHPKKFPRIVIYNTENTRMGNSRNSFNSSKGMQEANAGKVQDRTTAKAVKVGTMASIAWPAAGGGTFTVVAKGKAAGSSSRKADVLIPGAAALAPVTSRTAAPSAAQGWELLDVCLQAILHNITPLKADVWARHIEQAGLGERFGDILDGIHYGFLQSEKAYIEKEQAEYQ